MSKNREAKSISKTTWALLLVILGVFSIGAEANQPIPPFIHGQEAMFQGNLNEALRWYRITRRDFPDTTEGRQAVVQEFLILTSREIGNAKLASLYKEAADLQEIEGSHSKVYSELSHSFEKRSRRVLGDLIVILDTLERADLTDLTLTISIQPEVVESPKALSALEKGEWVDATKREAIEKSVYLRTYLGLLGQVTENQEDRVPYNIQNATLEPKSVFFALGSRMLIGGENFKQEKFIEASKTALSLVEKATEKTPYDKVRVAAQEMLKRVDELKRKGIKK